MIDRDKISCIIGGELKHHGIKDMSWGVRNGPPYPLSGAAKKMSTFLRKKKKQYAVASRAKKALKEQKHLDQINLKKQKLLAKGNMEAISKNASLFTNEELAAALARNQLMIEAKHAPNRRKAPDPHAFDTLVNMTDKIGQAAKNISPALDVAVKVADLVKKDKDIKAQDASNATKAVVERFNMLKGIDDQSALDLYNKVYGTDYKKRKKSGTFDTSIFNALAQLDPNEAAKYLNEYTGGSTSVNSTAIKDYLAVSGGKFPTVSGGGKSKGKSDD